MDMKYILHIYILKLEDGYYYVGRSHGIDKRLRTHFKHKGSRWTRLHNPLEIIDSIPFEVSSIEEEDRWENHITIKTMKEYGWRNVRGGFWCYSGEYETIKGLQSHGYFLDEDVESLVFKDRVYCIYTLELEDCCYFVGFTNNLKNILKKLEKGKTSKWLQIHKPISIIDAVESKCETGVMDIEIVNNIVIQAFKKYGYANVRGGSYIFIDPDIHRKLVKDRLGVNY